MSANNLMSLGSFVAVVATVSLFLTRDPSLSILIFSGGALFGKGYRRYEERSDI